MASGSPRDGARAAARHWRRPARTQGGSNGGAIAPTEDAARRRPGAVAARGMLRGGPRLALPLLVARVLANHQHVSVAADDLALLAHRFDRRSYLHDPLRVVPDGSALAAVTAAATARGLRADRPGQVTRAQRVILPTPPGSPSGRCHGVRTRGPSAVTATVNSKCAVI